MTALTYYCFNCMMPTRNETKHNFTCAYCESFNQVDDIDMN